MSEPLKERQRKVLFATIAEYVETGKPVSSKSISAAGSLGLSSASIRRIMHELTLMGFLFQPHTSAGRVPTDAAFRTFVDALRDGSGHLDSDTRDVLSGRFKGLIPTEPGSWRETVRVLSDLSTQTALAITPAVSDAVLRQLRFVPLEGSQLLAVIVTKEGLVHNTHLVSDEIMDAGELERVHNYLSSVIGGKSLNEVRSVLREELLDARAKCDALRQKAALLGARALESSQDDTSQMLVEGRSRLFERPELSGSLRDLMIKLEEKKRILALLDQAADSDEGPLVIIGREGGDDFEGCTLISAPFGKGSGGGMIGIVGSSRMNYPAMIPLVALSAKLIDDTLGDGE